MRVYIAGKMRGVFRYNFPAFDKQKGILSAKGWTVVSPADLDRAAGFDPDLMPADTDWSEAPAGHLADAIDRDLRALRECDAICLLPGWETSKGANVEAAYAAFLDLDRVNPHTGEIML